MGTAGVVLEEADSWYNVATMHYEGIETPFGQAPAWISGPCSSISLRKAAMRLPL